MKSINRYSGFYCVKCNSIPLIQILPKKNDIKIYTACNCHIRYQNIDLFNRNFYKNNIDINKISQNKLLSKYNLINDKVIQEIDIDKIIEDFSDAKEQMNLYNKELKDKIIQHYLDKIKNINNLYEQYNKLNDKLILLITQLINSYKSLKTNFSNILNLSHYNKFNCDFNRIISSKKLKLDLNSCYKDIENYFKKQYIIKNPIDYLSDLKYFIRHTQNPIKNFIEFSENYGASCTNEPYIVVYNFHTNFIPFIFKAHSKEIYYIINTTQGDIISFGNDGDNENYLKIWPNEEIIKNINENKNENKNIIVDINPLFEQLIKFEEINETLTKMIILKENELLLLTKKMIYFYEFSLEGKKFDLIRTKTINGLIDIIYIRNDLIGGYNKNELFFINYPSLIIKGVINGYKKLNNKNLLLNLNEKEVLLADKNVLSIINVENCQVKMNIKYENQINMLYKLIDNSILCVAQKDIKRYYYKTLEEIQLLSHNYDDVNDIFQLSNGKLILCLEEGIIKLCKINYF